MFRKSPQSAPASAAATAAAAAAGVSASARPQAMAHRGLEAVAIRNEWYRDRYSTVLRALAVVGLVALIEAVSIGILITTRPEPKYFAVDAKGSVIPIVPLQSPMLTNGALAQWAGETAREAYNLDFVNWRAQLNSLRDRFSGAAYDAYVDQMNSSGNLAAVRDSRMILEAIAEPAIITKMGVVNGRYTWYVEVPLQIVTHYGGDKRRNQAITVRMTVTRVDNRFRPEAGVVVTEFLTQLG